MKEKKPTKSSHLSCLAARSTLLTSRRDGDHPRYTFKISRATDGAAVAARIRESKIRYRGPEADAGRGSASEGGGRKGDFGRRRPAGAVPRSGEPVIKIIGSIRRVTVGGVARATARNGANCRECEATATLLRGSGVAGAQRGLPCGIRLRRERELSANRCRVRRPTRWRGCEAESWPCRGCPFNRFQPLRSRTPFAQIERKSSD